MNLEKIRNVEPGSTNKNGNDDVVTQIRKTQKKEDKEKQTEKDGSTKSKDRQIVEISGSGDVRSPQSRHHSLL